MSSTATSGAAVVSPAERVEVLFEELAELAGQRNAIDGRIVEIVAELDRDGLWGVTGARSVAGLVAWKMGCSSGNAHTIATVVNRPGMSGDSSSWKGWGHVRWFIEEVPAGAA